MEDNIKISVRRIKMVKLLLVAFLCIALTGCASARNYKKESAEKTTLIQSLKTRVAELSKENERLSADRDHLENRLAENLASQSEEEIK